MNKTYIIELQNVDPEGNNSWNFTHIKKKSRQSVFYQQNKNAEVGTRYKQSNTYITTYKNE